MGTNDYSVDDKENQGLIPRFLFDLFENLNDQSAANKSEIRSHSVLVSFLEIYGEDVYDLLGYQSNRNTSSTGVNDRPSLSVRENEHGHVFVQGQQEIVVESAVAALEILHTGSRSRITASTAMNSGSSRSHAVFTITVRQSIGAQIPATEMNDDITPLADVNDAPVVTSKLTFVDLAGSERIKRTGAEGQRLKEGIQINSGLFNLGQVINGLADEQRLQKGNKQAYIPYRNSKLTHLLKDALGGNSQTLFLACVSPAESNESETFSTLTYARQARNIQNKPVRNTDKAQDELRRLRYAVKTWMTKAVTRIFRMSFSNGIDGMVVSSPSNDKVSRFDADEDGISSTSCSPLPSISSPAGTGNSGRVSVSGGPSKICTYSTLFQRADVQAYIDAVNVAINEKLKISDSTSRKVSFLIIIKLLLFVVVDVVDYQKKKISIII